MLSHCLIHTILSFYFAGMRETTKRSVLVLWALLLIFSQMHSSHGQLHHRMGWKPGGRKRAFTQSTLDNRVRSHTKYLLQTIFHYFHFLFELKAESQNNKERSWKHSKLLSDITFEYLNFVKYWI